MERQLTRLRSIDWDFTGQLSESAFARSHWHPGRLVSQVPAALIGVLSEPGSFVLDPFVGSGTTAVEAQRLGRRSHGIDLNPIAVLIAKAKTLSMPASNVTLLLQRIRLSWRNAFATTRGAVPEIPSSVQAEKWYNPLVRRHLAIAWSALQRLGEPEREIGLALFSSVLLPVCRETRHWGFVCDNTAPKLESEHGGDVAAELERAAGKLQSAYERRDQEMSRREEQSVNVPSAVVTCGDALTTVRAFEKHSVDLVVTSPPYFGVCDYIKSQRLTLEWLGLEIEPLRREEVGARSKRHRQSALKEFADYLTALLGELHRSLKPEGYCCMIIGESASRTRFVETLVDSLPSLGHEVVYRVIRRVSSQRRQNPSLHAEHVVVTRPMEIPNDPR